MFIDEIADQPGWTGEPLFTPEAFRAAAIDIDARGLQISVHAIGDGAVRLVLDGYQAAQEVNGRRDSRHRIEHVELIHADDLARFAELGVIASIQPLHVPALSGNGMDAAVSAIGPDRWPLAYAWRSLIDAGAPFCFSSDWPIVTVEPLVSISASQQRRRWADHLPDQRVTLNEALDGYTWRGAYAGFTEDKIGRIKTGMRADLVLLSGDVTLVAPADIPALGPAMTICDGRVTFQG